MGVIPIIDIFAGPGGLGEGFASVMADGDPAFNSVSAIEMERSAHSTLTLRSAFRDLRDRGQVPSAYYRFLRAEITESELRQDGKMVAALERASRHVHQLELGPETREVSDLHIKVALDGATNWVLIGGPPCQAYSLVGRSRRANDVTFEDDKKHFLYQEYLHIIRKFSPAVFVMENVKGLLSSTHGGQPMFARIREDLKNEGGDAEYVIYSLTVPYDPEDLSPRDFIIRSEDHGVPQQRHRLILLGVRRDITTRPAVLQKREQQATVREAIGHLPVIRSRISRGRDAVDAWANVRSLAHLAAKVSVKGFGETLRPVPPLGQEFVRGSKEVVATTDLQRWLTDPAIGGFANHVSRGHMESDLYRYFFAAAFGSVNSRSPLLTEFARDLLPNHNAARLESKAFADRFKVQLWDKPSSTVVSHIAKDGHYYIHPDPSQMRSLTVREAARLQTFPDNYAFLGNRTQQYTQIGNAVPPYLAHQIGNIVRDLLIAA
ncbi:DNA cytosine methyltransferase [Pseudarthrobacter sp. MDT3-28]|uniref:DNA cytosine methyltransferase n=1 Tax=Pseudarthrobacter raffinosi TaxID=2953651 RepID=UPI00208E13CA|nr:DNA cytosine methyltransferase [Pseudarthrobacter sp. MDT3-28]MCO4239480.1 DNA cytosine methyltransferase [Pseudarthrobacter sp. MDT3-28]